VAAQGNSLVQLACFDVDKPDLIDLVKIEDKITEEIVASLPVVDISKCRYCGVCSGFCPQKAIQFNRYVPYVTLIVSRCSACGNCLKECTRNGIQMNEKSSGKIIQGKLGENYFIAGYQDKSSDFQKPLLSAMFQKLVANATVICDFGPGVECMEVADFSEINFGIVVVNQSIDWEKNTDFMIEMAQKNLSSFGIIFNNLVKNSEFEKEIKTYCIGNDIPFLGVIPFDENLSHNSSENSFGQSETLNSVFSEIWMNTTEAHKAAFNYKK
jgi:MinD superfamily P-loop ATPase